MYRRLLTLTAMSLLAGVAYGGEEGTFAIIKRIAGPDGNWDYVTADSARRRLYVARDYGVMAIDLDSGAVTGRLIPGHGVHGMAVVPNGNLIVSTNGDTNTVTIFDANSGKTLGDVPTGKEPDAVVFDPKFGLIIVFNHAGGNATVIDPQSRKVVGTIAVGGTLESGTVDEQGRTYVNVADKNHIAAIDIGKRRVSEVIPLDGCEEPSGLAYDAADNMLISACFNGVVDFVNPRTHQLLAKVATGKFPDAVIWDARRRLAFIPSFADGTLTVIRVRDAHDIKVIQKLATQPGTRTGALDANTGNVYLPTSKLNPPAKEGAYPTPVAGTFEVLVVRGD
jgi:DNA-binding beta-propeller fold protein YncE